MIFSNFSSFYCMFNSIKLTEMFCHLIPFYLSYPFLFIRVPIYTSKSASIRCISPIKRLFGHCCPFAIFSTIVSVVIYSLNRVAFRSWSNIRHKVIKTSIPSFANGDASPSIIWIALIVLVVTSGSHTNPDCIFFCIFGLGINHKYLGSNINFHKNAS